MLSLRLQLLAADALTGDLSRLKSMLKLLYELLKGLKPVSQAEVPS